MILVIGTIDEPVSEHFVAWLAGHGRDFLFVDERQLGAEVRVEIAWEPIAARRSRLDGAIHFPSWSVSLDEVSGIYSRLGVGPAPEGGRPPAERVERAHFFELLDLFPGPVANRPTPSASNASKFCQYGAILDAGFRLPDTFAGGRLADLERFLAPFAEPPVVKSTSDERSIVKQISLDALRAIADRDLLPPHQFQERLRGRNVRVHVIGGEHVFACGAETGALDYRHPDRTGHTVRLHAMELPAPVAEACRRLARALAIDLAGIDLLEPEGGSPEPSAWGCFEVNTCPGYSWFEQMSDLPITACLADFLSAR